MKMNLIVLPRKKFNDDDLFNFLDILDGTNYIANKNREVSTGIYNTKVLPDFDINEIFTMKENHFDRIIFISDEGFKDFLSLEIQAIFTRFLNSFKTVILCSLAQIAFLKMGLLTGRSITYNYDEFPEYIKYFNNSGVKLITKHEYYVDKNLITLKGRDSIYNLGEDLNRIEENMENII
ncbi:protease I [Nanobdella aerobiophila]|uniref:Protease I n=1 Tax=Nanobdella aerobiophila TaxID=2586965 RepID=A0A915WT37_9ARCH|nr:hypothetical protein [Nanobdella aerobiophila]BBL45822.1 protease I [Nanobdella aerobiophila]